MSIAITEDHRALASTAADLLTRRNARDAARELLESPTEGLPKLWADVVELGWLGLHLPESQGGSGYGIEELVIVVEEMARMVAPGPFVPTVIASAVIAATADDATKARLLPGLADGSVIGGVALGGSISVAGDKASGSAGAVLGGGLANLIVATSGDDVVIIEVGDGVDVKVPPNLDPTRRSARVTLDGATATVVAGARQTFVDLARVILSADAVGVARECTNMAAEYAKNRLQFGRPIAMYQGVKHHCANMAVATELATSAVWDAARASTTGGDQLSYAAAVAATLSAPAADLCANLNTQVHGGIAITWEHDAHLYMRRATTLLTQLEAGKAAADIVELTRRGVVREKAIELPPEAEAIRTEVQRVRRERQGPRQPTSRRPSSSTPVTRCPTGPSPSGATRAPSSNSSSSRSSGPPASAVPATASRGGTSSPSSSTAPTTRSPAGSSPALNHDVIWCQLFSEPDAGSDAAGIKTKATRVDGGWLVNGQKVWTSGAHVAGMGFATVRTNPDVPKHDGITTMAIDMHAKGVEVRPLKMTTGNSEFNEVFFSDVFVADDDVVGPVDGGWTVARATLGNESVSIGGGDGGMSMPGGALVGPFDANAERLTGGAPRIGRYIAEHQAMGLLNLRSANRAVSGAEPGPEGAITKLVLSEFGHESAAILTELNGQDSAFMDGAAGMSNMLVLMHRGMSIAGGTSEIKRNQIGERILGLPRDPLLK